MEGEKGAPPTSVTSAVLCAEHAKLRGDPSITPPGLEGASCDERLAQMEA